MQYNILVIGNKCARKAESRKREMEFNKPKSKKEKTKLSSEGEETE